MCPVFCSCPAGLCVSSALQSKLHTHGKARVRALMRLKPHAVKTAVYIYTSRVRNYCLLPLLRSYTATCTQCICRRYNFPHRRSHMAHRHVESMSLAQQTQRDRDRERERERERERDKDNTHYANTLYVYACTATLQQTSYICRIPWPTFCSWSVALAFRICSRRKEASRKLLQRTRQRRHSWIRSLPGFLLIS